MNKKRMYRYDVFISYNHADQKWVLNWLLPALESYGLSVCIDEHDFVVGEPILRNIERAIDNSRHTLLILTPAWVQSEWTEFELLLTQTTDPSNRNRRLLPILHQNCDMPRHILNLNYADFTQERNWDIQLQRVVAAIRGDLGFHELDQIPTHKPRSLPDGSLSSLNERFSKLVKKEQIPIACIGGIYLDIEIDGIQLDENGKHYLDFTREVPVRVNTHPGGSVYYVAQYLNELDWNPLIVSFVGDGSKKGFANILLELAARDGTGISKRIFTPKRDAETAVTVHFLHPDAQYASSAMYTARDVLKSFGWQQAIKILKEAGRVDNQDYESGVIYFAGFFKTSLDRDLHKNLRKLQNNGAIIFLDHGRLAPDLGMEDSVQIRNLAEALRLVDVYFCTKEELSQFIDEVTKSLPEHERHQLHINKSLPNLIEEVVQKGIVHFPPILLIKDRSRTPRTHIVGVRNTSGDFTWKEIKVTGRSLYPPIRECIVGASNAFNAAFMDAFLNLNREINIDSIVSCAEEAHLRLIGVEAGYRIDDPPTLMKGKKHA